MGCNGVPKLWIEQAFHQAWHGDAGEAAEYETEDGHDNTTSNVRPDLSCILAASQAACTSPMARNDCWCNIATGTRRTTEQASTLACLEGVCTCGR